MTLDSTPFRRDHETLRGEVNQEVSAHLAVANEQETRLHTLRVEAEANSERLSRVASERDTETARANEAESAAEAMITAHKDLQQRYERAQHTVSVLSEAAEHIEKQAAARIGEEALEKEGTATQQRREWMREKVSLEQQHLATQAALRDGFEASLQEAIAATAADLTACQGQLGHAQEDQAEARKALEQSRRCQEALDKDNQGLRHELQVSVEGLQQWQAMALEAKKPAPGPAQAQFEALERENAELHGVVQALRDETQLLEADLMRQEAALRYRQ